MNCKLLITEDGSHTLFVPDIDECYHSSHGAVQESRHIFIEAALRQCHKNELTVLEVGFGTGLNALLTLAESLKNERKINYITIEKFPLKVDTALLLNYPEQIDIERSFFEQLHSCEWNVPAQITPDFLFEKIEADFTFFEHKTQYDVVYFDAFSPDKQPEMWSQSQFDKIFNYCSSGAALTTYCAKGVVRRAMQATGFKVERLPGPPGKREILRAWK